MINFDKLKKNNKKYFMGVDIGGTKIWICITDLSGKIVYKKKIPTTDSVIEIKEIIMRCLKEANILLKELDFISFGVPGITNSDAGVVLDAPALDWMDFPFIKEMETQLSIPMFVNNDVNCAALGERWIGSAHNVNDFVFIAIGTGVGGAIVTNGKIVYGENFMAGEIGYFMLEEDVENLVNNDKGKFGVFERKISGTALAQYGIDPEELFKQYKKDDLESIKIVEEFINYLSVGIANVVSLLNPKAIILGGGVAQSLDDLIPLITQSVAKYTPVTFSIKQSQLGELSGAIGAIAFGKEQKEIEVFRKGDKNEKEGIK